MKNKLKNQRGFTIIEVLIVLAIAGLILLIVFLAVPALQRNQRNTGRKQDAARFGTAVNNYVSNNSGKLPTTADWPATSCPSILKDLGTPNQGTWVAGPNCVEGAEGQNALDHELGAFTAADQTKGFEIILVTNAVCNGTQSTSAGTTRQAALLYDLETGSGNYNWACITIQ